MAPLPKEILDAERIEMQHRDNCASFLVPLNRCRYETRYKTWKCTDERHAYEKCQYEEYCKRMELAKAAKAAAAASE
ncbi:hypothetical protein SARC_09949 [Sphaeroforma arctica JP610]|uniref:NADH dehydrogenase [ubiquinone] 1 beta subcomplex subunit 7 n=1 Tax=Sphaeroforma arctica JP610 TaxID=667725 RepID=A0A0L0FM96_9EUKA|nr:hypothetical protein SARC_09949 [Sphaeroforma arctica JP610]KNC77591.1 hypothetical protein SARC_09949 [Sphaeroforma arctica JP610]|eukprot:XP_014151493.1 hypothetical protein SARC_09949 [Sphaeroforma arctica JP610]